jgi:hypothetical protein
LRNLMPASSATAAAQDAALNSQHMAVCGAAFPCCLTAVCATAAQCADDVDVGALRGHARHLPVILQDVVAADEGAHEAHDGGPAGAGA